MFIKWQGIGNLEQNNIREELQQIYSFVPDDKFIQREKTILKIIEERKIKEKNDDFSR